MLSIIIPWCDRPELKETLRANAEYFKGAEFIVVNYGGDPELLRHCIDNVDVKLRLLTVKLPEKSVFVKSRALNLGISVASRDICLCLDADILIEDFCVDDLVEGAESLGMFITLQWVRDEPAHSIRYIDLPAKITNMLEISLEDGRSTIIELSSYQSINNARSGPGIVAVSKKALLEIGGYDSELQGWGWEDVDLIARLQLAGLQRLVRGRGLHLGAPSVHTAERVSSEARNRTKCLSKYAAGNMKGSIVLDAELLGSNPARK